MGSTPKKRNRKPKKEKEKKEQEDKTIGETFPNITAQTLNQLQNFFKIGLSAELTHTQPGMPGRKTTQRVFRYLDEEMLKNYDMDANNRQKLAKQRNKSSFERLLLKLEIALAKVEKTLDVAWKRWEQEGLTMAKLDPPELPKDFELNQKDERLRLSLITTIAEVRDHIATTDYTLTIYEADEAQILSHLEKKAEKIMTT